MMKVLLALAFIKLVSCTISHNYLPPNRGGFSGSSFGGSHQSNAFSGSFSSSGRQVPIVRYDNTNEGDGSYQYTFETGNGISVQERGEAGGDGTRAHGGYSYTSPEGQLIRVTYTADENGYRPEGAHLPTPPPIPEAILKSIQQNLAEEARGVIDDGSYRENNRGGGGHFGGSSFSGSSFGGSHHNNRGGYGY